MVFTLNTTVFAEEVAVDSVEETVDATVDAVDEEATVDATTDAGVDATETQYLSFMKYTTDEKGTTLNTEISYLEDSTVKKNAPKNVVKMTNVASPLSWANIYKNKTGYGYANPADPGFNLLDDGHGNVVVDGADLIYTVLKGAEEDDANLVNDKEVKISSNGAAASEESAKALNQLRGSRFVGYKVIDLGDNSHYLFVGYGDKYATQDGKNLWTEANVDGVEGIIPVTEFDGRQIAFSKDGKHKATTSKREKLDVAAALVEYKDGTLTEIPGVEVTGVSFAKKTGKDATVSGQMSKFGWSYDKWNPTEKKVETVTKDGGNALTYSAYKKNADLGTFTVKVKVKNNKDIDKTVKKAITDKLKNEKFTYAISQFVVDVTVSDTVQALFTHYDAEGSPVENKKHTLSTNDAYDYSPWLFAETDNWDEIGIDGDNFFMRKFDATKGKGDLSFAVYTYNGKKGDTAELKLKAGTDYDFSEKSLAGTPVKALEFKGNFIYRDASTENLAGYGYKYAFRQSPDVNGKKQKTFRDGIVRDTNDGFVYSVDDAAADSVEEAF